MSSIDLANPYRAPLSSSGQRSLNVMQERAVALRRLAEETPDRRANLLDVAQRLEGLANQAALAVFGQSARLSDRPAEAPNAEKRDAGAQGTGARSSAADVGLFPASNRKASTLGFDV